MPAFDPSPLASLARRLPALRLCVCVSLCAWLGLAQAASAAPADTALAACDRAGGQASRLPAPAWSDRPASLRDHARLPPGCLEGLVRQCLRASEEGFLDGGAAAQCSVRYEALLQHRFGGDFRSLLAWWRSQRAPEGTADTP